MESTEAELVSIHGRRRVGKTFLVREHVGEHVAFELTGVHGAPLKEQLRNFATSLGAALRSALPPAPPRDWQEAFQQLSVHLGSPRRRSAKRVVFFDELPWLASRRSGFLRAFEHFWNSWAVKRNDLVVIVCGSASAWMVQRLLHAKGGLHNRVTRQIRLEPFSIAETEDYFRSRRIDVGRYQLLELYMALGGVPHYLKQIERGESAAAAIDRLCFVPSGALRDEFPKLYASLFEHSDRHEAVVRALAKKPSGLTRESLIHEAGLPSGGSASQLFRELEESGFIARTPHFGNVSKEAVYRLIDPYSLFYLKWIDGRRNTAEAAWQKRRGTPAWRAWSGYAFEGICLEHVSWLKAALGIEAVETETSAWRHGASDRAGHGAQIDLVIDRKDATINLCEMKFSESEFTIDKRYAAELRNKRNLFRDITGTRKALLLTLVTTYGVRENAHKREIVDVSLDMDALFARG